MSISEERINDVYQTRDDAIRVAMDISNDLRATQEVLRQIISYPRWLSIGSIDNVAELRISRELYERAQAALKLGNNS